MLRKTIIAVICLAAVLPSFGQTRAYEYQDELEEIFGPTWGVFSVTGEQGKALGVGDTEGFFHLRYTHFFSKHFGAYVQYGSENARADEAAYFGAQNKADGGLYRYQYHYCSGFQTGFESAFFLGGAYRLDFGNAGFRARAGLGYGTITDGSVSYVRQNRSGEGGPTYFDLTVERYGANPEYLTKSSSRYSISAFMMAASAQITYKVGRVYFLLEAGVDWSPTKYSLTTTSTGSKIGYNPSNFVEAVANYDLQDTWVIDKTSARSVTTQRCPGPMFHLAGGIGISLGKSHSKNYE